MLQYCIIKTMTYSLNKYTSKLTQLQEQAMNDIIVKNLCFQFNVHHIVKYPLEMSREDKAEFFLLGASFTSVDIQGNNCSVMIYNDTMHILSVEA